MTGAKPATSGGKPASKTATPAKASEAEAPAKPAARKKLSFKEQRELDGLPALIQQLESQQKAIQQELYDGSVYARDAKRAGELTARNSKLEEELMDALQRWETLSA